jgi:hypothetical protein
MIGSVFEQRDQLAGLERRRQDIAAQQSVAPAAAPVPGVIAAGMPPAGSGTTTMAVKATEPDIAKRRKARCDRKGHDLSDGAATGAVDEGRGWRDAMDDEARKTYAQRGATEGPRDFAEPGMVVPGQFGRDYLAAGHAAGSPQTGPPRQSPVVHAPQGIVQAITLPDAPVVGYVPSHVTARVSMGSPSERAR